MLFLFLDSSATCYAIGKQDSGSLQQVFTLGITTCESNVLDFSFPIPLTLCFLQL